MSDIDWHKIGHELDYRSKALAASGHYISSETGDGYEEIRLASNLVEEEEKYQEDDRIRERWDWVFQPLLLELFEKDVALWACLGYFQGGRTSSVRRWRYFFSESLSPDSNPEEFRRALRAFTFNACFSDKAEEVILPTSKFLEQLAAENLDDEQYPHGTTLFASLKNGSNVLDELRNARESDPHYLDERTILADWSQLFDCAQDYEGERRRMLERMLPHKVIRNHLKKEESGEVSLHLPEGNVDDAVEGAEGYSSALKNTFAKRLPSAAYFLRERSNSKHGQRIEDYFDEYPDESEKLTQYIGWIHDVACGQTGGLITIPAWFPGASTGGRSGAIILGLREEAQLSLEDFSGLISTFRMGSTSVAMEDQKEKGRQVGIGEVIENFSHEINKLNQAISFSRTPKMGAVFQINELKRPQNDVLDDWYEPAGVIDTEQEHEHVLEDWRICPTPHVLEGLSNVLAIWGGNRGWRSEVGLNSQMPLMEVLDKLVEVAGKTVVAEQFLNKETPDNVSRAAGQEREFREKLNALPSVEIRPDSEAENIKWLGDRAEASPQQSEFVRLFVASLSNVFEHANLENPIEVTIESNESSLHIRILNTIRDDDNTGTTSGVGTEDVLEMSCARLGGNLERFGMTQDNECWNTSLSLPKPSNEDITWLNV